MRHQIILPLFLLGLALSAALPPRAAADGPAVIDLATGRINMDAASQGAPFTIWSASEGGKTRVAPRGGRSYYETTADYAYRGGTLFDPRDYVVAVLRTYNRALTSRVVVSAGLGVDYATFAGHRPLAGLSRSVGVAWRVAQSDRIALEAQVRWMKYTTPGNSIAGLAPMVRLRWESGR